MTNYIEVEHYHKDGGGDENWDIYYAVKPTNSRFKFKGDGREKVSTWNPGWTLEGGNGITISTRENVAGLRKLLDAVETQIQGDEK